MTIFKEPDITGSVVCHNIPEDAGVYLITDSDGTVFYVGSSDCLRRRIAQLHVPRSRSGRYLHCKSPQLTQFQAEGKDALVQYILCEDYKTKERQLKRQYNPPWNKQ